MTRSAILTMALLLAAASSGAAQVNQIQLGVTGSSSRQPPIAVFAARGLDSVRTIVQRDLQNSDLFSVALLGDSAGTLSAPLDSATVKGVTGYAWLVELQHAPNGVMLKLWNVVKGTVQQQAASVVDLSGVGDTRLTIHRVSDQVVNWTGGIGIAASRIAFKMKNGAADAIWRIDSDGANLVRVSRTDRIEFTPAWSPDGATLAYSEYADGKKTLILQKLSTGTKTPVTSMPGGDAYGGNFHPDGKTMVYTFAGPTGGAVIATVDVAKNCCAHDLTHDRKNADNQSASYSPNGLHIAYISNRTGSPQIWVMDADGTNNEALVPSEFDERGRALDTYSPMWSPDNTKLVFSRDTRGGSRQVWSWSIGGGPAVQMTSHGRNEDPSWAPDSRHIVFKSWQTGREQLWIYDTVSGATRQFGTPGGAQYPAWSPILGTNP